MFDPRIPAFQGLQLHRPRRTVGRTQSNDKEASCHAQRRSLGRETFYKDGERIGWLCVAGLGHTVNRALGLGYLRAEEQDRYDDAMSMAGHYEIEIRTRRVPATRHCAPLYDPIGERVRA
ncbi:glycine cleavage T C-terminal barrel domain-containing protein [Mesorhizobium sp. M0204]|uniref:glycine cleavage T C-terminal barrel domain-containing protein n=1 Tax=Mesorhizobium sp. M0204 TaxID=2956913 RepID=UPI00333D0249